MPTVLNCCPQTCDIGESATLYELSAIISKPGCRQQVLHSDTIASSESDANAILLTTFVALQDISRCMGPTVMYPGFLL